MQKLILAAVKEGIEISFRQADAPFGKALIMRMHKGGYSIERMISFLSIETANFDNLLYERDAFEALKNEFTKTNR